MTRAAADVLRGAARETRNTAPRVVARGWSPVRPPPACLRQRVRAVPFVPLVLAVGRGGGGCAAALRERPRRPARVPGRATRVLCSWRCSCRRSRCTHRSFAYATDAKEQSRRADVRTGGAEPARGPPATRLQQAIDQIDAHAVAARASSRTRTTRRRPTDPRDSSSGREPISATYRLTSAVELYSADGRLVSRFALTCRNTRRRSTRAPSCTWEELFDEVSPFGSSERHVAAHRPRHLRRAAVCVGAIVVRVMLDYRTLPFISSQSPYLESLRPNRQRAAGRRVGTRRRVRDVRLEPRADYRIGHERVGAADACSIGWSQSRQPFWDTSSATANCSASYFLSDRGGIYALGYPVITLVGPPDQSRGADAAGHACSTSALLRARWYSAR